jgi:predicted lipoprotein with Yx(FWY)xxD motif
VAVLGGATLTLLAASCGAATNSLNPGREEVSVAHNSHLGRVLVDDEGRTLYLFVRDPPNRSTCYGACASIWPPLTTAAMPRAGRGIDAAKLTTFKRHHGRAQVAYNGHPLYYYQGDTEGGDAYGENLSQFGAEWYVVSPGGQPVGPKGASSGS